VTAFIERARERVKPDTLRVYEWMLGQLVNALGGATPLDKLTAERVEGSARKKKWSSSTRHDYLGAVGVFLRDAGHPLRLRRPPKESRGATAVWTDEEFLMMLGAARGDFKPLLVLLKETGCRPSEACTLTVENVDWERRLAILKEHKNAGKGKARIIHFSEAAFAVLAEQRRQYQKGALFLNEDGDPFRSITITHRIASCRDRAGVKRPLHAYGLRHSYICKALKCNLSADAVAALVGNSAQIIRSNYSHIGQDAAFLKELVDKVAKAG
jgi:integrase